MSRNSYDGNPASYGLHGLRRLWPRRLGGQLILLFSLMLAGSMFVFSYRMLHAMVDSNTSSMKMQAGVLAKDLSATGADFLLKRDYSSIEEMLLRTIDFPGVIAIQICDANGKLVGDVSRDPGMAAIVHYGRTPLQVPSHARPSMLMSDGRMVVWQPILLGDLLGWTRITYSLKDIEDAENRFWLINGLVGSVIIGLTLVGLFLLMRRPLTSVSRYTEFAGKLNEMHGKTMAIDNSSIELQKLGYALNRASVRLEEQSVAVSNAMSDLEGLAAFPENDPNIVLSIAADGKVTYLNPGGFRTLTSLEPWSKKVEVLLPQKIEVLLPRDYPALVERSLDDGKTVRGIEVEYNERTWLWTFAPLASQRIVHGYGLEITKRKKAEQYARNVLTEKKAAEAASQAKSVFLANMSHEIRTPLNGVLGFLNLLSKTSLTEVQRDYLKTTEVSARMLLAIINDILDFSKVEAGKISIEQVEIEFKELLEDIVSLHAASAESKGLDLILVFARSVPTRLLGDPARITQVISNLIGNAIKFTEQGEVLVQVDLRQETDTEALVEVSVKDSGIGISPESLERLFQPFSQADASTTRRYGGTGLGLVITKTLVELMGGEISVESQEGRGASFAFTLRLAKQTVPRLPMPAHPPDYVANLRILAVTPNARIARSLSESLHAWGCQVDSEGSGVAALAALEQEADQRQGYDVVIVDDALEAMTPQAFIEQLRKKLPYSGIPVILLCGVSKNLHADGPGPDGFDAYLSKPVRSTDLLRELEKAFLGDKKIPAARAREKFKMLSREGNRKLRVLVVDDNEINRKLARMLVEHLGGETDTAEDGALAVEACLRQAYDLILMDAHMPVMDGIEATIRIRESEKGSQRHAPIIALTANAMSGDRERYLAAGMDEYLTKPLNEKAFTSVLHKLGLVVPDEESAPLRQSDGDPGDPLPLPVLDPKMGVELSFGNRETWQTILGMLLDELPSYADKLVAAASAGEMDVLRQTAHKLAGASSYCGTPALNQQAAYVEVLAKGGDVASIAKSVDGLLQQIARLSALRGDKNLADSESPVY